MIHGDRKAFYHNFGETCNILVNNSNLKVNCLIRLVKILIFLKKLCF